MLAEVSYSLSFQARFSGQSGYERKGDWEPILLGSVRVHVVRLWWQVFAVLFVALSHLDSCA